MAKFLSQAEVYRLIQRELPEDAYPDGEPTAFFSTADSDATARVIADLYANLQRIYLNNYPQTADERIDDWEIKVFGYVQTGGLSLAQRQARILAKLRTKRSLRPADQAAIVQGVIGSNYVVQVLGWGVAQAGYGYVWSIGESELGVGTVLGDFGKYYATGPQLFSQSGADWGMSSGDWTNYLEQSYTYVVRIYEYTPTADELAEINRQLDISERYTCQRVIETNVPASQYVAASMPPMVEP